MERPPASYAIASLALFYLDPKASSIAIPLSVIAGNLALRYRVSKTLLTLSATLLAFLGSYYIIPELSLFSFLTLLYVDQTLSFAPLPFALLAAGGVPAVSPLLGGYPSSVKAGLPAWLPPTLSLPQCCSLGGTASALGFATGYVFAFLLDKLSAIVPNQPMVKLSEPIFVGIAAGIMINIVRIRVRLASGIKAKLRVRRRGRAY